jgi:hypothetical protein
MKNETYLQIASTARKAKKNETFSFIPDHDNTSFLLEFVFKQYPIRTKTASGNKVIVNITNGVLLYELFKNCIVVTTHKGTKTIYTYGT